MTCSQRKSASHSAGFSRELLSDGFQSYTWDAAGRLRRVDGPGGLEVEYQYDGANSRVSSEVDGELTRYLVDPFSPIDRVPQVLVEKTAGERTRYLYGLDLLGQVQGGTPAYLGYDALSVRLHVNNSGEIESTYRYGPFGETVGEGPEGYGFTGESWDAFSGLLYLRARYYAPAVGRFVSRDTWAGRLAEPGTLHRFAYVGNNAVNLADPTGRDYEQWYFDKYGRLPSNPPYLLQDGEYYYQFYMSNPYVWWEKFVLRGDADYSIFALEAYSELVLHEPFRPFGSDTFNVLAEGWRELRVQAANGGDVCVWTTVALAGMLFMETGGGEFTEMGGGVDINHLPGGTQLKRVFRGDQDFYLRQGEEGLSVYIGATDEMIEEAGLQGEIRSVTTDDVLELGLTIEKT